MIAQAFFAVEAFPSGVQLAGPVLCSNTAGHGSGPRSRVLGFRV